MGLRNMVNTKTILAIKDLQFDKNYSCLITIEIELG